MKLNWFPIMTACLLTQSVMAETPTRPLTCPRVSAVSAALDNMELKQQNKDWYGKLTNASLGTPYQWAIYTMPVPADNKKTAARLIKKMVSTSVYYGGPENSEDIWGCVYFSNEIFITIAITPSQDWDSLPDFKRF